MTKREYIKTSPIERKKKKIINKNKVIIESEIDENINEIIEKINYKEEYYKVKQWNEIVFNTFQQYNITSINE